MKKIIYDFGANNGHNIPYYLLKSDLVVAVEADPLLSEKLKDRFPTELAQGKLIIENAALTDSKSGETVSFYIHKEHNILSQFPKPSSDKIDEFEKIKIPSVNAADLILRHGSPHYIKIDIEHFDAQILRCLFENDIRPKYISAENHGVEVFSALVSLGGYNAFKLVEGWTVPDIYSEVEISSMDGSKVEYSFPEHCAGPYGNDIQGDWLTGSAMLRKLGIHSFGWKDIHASRDSIATSKYSLIKDINDVILMKIRRKLKNFLSN